MQQMLPSKALLVSKSGATNFLSSHHGGCATSSRRSENVLEAASVTGMQAGFGVQRFLNFKATPDHHCLGANLFPWYVPVLSWQVWHLTQHTRGGGDAMAMEKPSERATS
jgi:hypothetical protein